MVLTYIQKCSAIQHSTASPVNPHIDDDDDEVQIAVISIDCGYLCITRCSTPFLLVLYLAA